MVNRVLIFLHQRGYTRLLSLVSMIAYFLKGFGYVDSSYLKSYRAYSYKVNGVVYLSSGPGWAYSYQYLLDLLKKTFCYNYVPVPGDCVIDIGAGLGEESVVYAKLVGTSGKVFSLEANPITFGGLSYMVQRNKLNWVTPLNIAIFCEDGEVTIEDDIDNYLVNTINTKVSEKNLLTVKAQKFDTIVKQNKIRKIDFLKSNIEGAEQYLIEGMDESISIVKNLCISCHDFRHNYHSHGEFYLTKEKVLKFLKSHGFEITVRDTGNRAVDDYIYATNPRIK